MELKEKQCDYLDYISRAINDNLKAKRNMDDNFLIILGDSKVKAKDEMCNYTPYVWNGEKFVPLSGA